MLALAMIIDAILGEPKALWDRVPHPVVLMGRLITILEEGLNSGPLRHAKGVLALLILILVCGAPALFLSISLFQGVFEVVIAAILLSQRSLIDHVGAVTKGLSRSLEEGRSAVAQIVGRDVQTLDEQGVARAAIESGAENFSDGVVAPAFWFLLLGLPGIVVYKAINTADSMIGHRSDRYREFGWAAARLDDLVNLIPARLAGFLICAAGGGKAAAEIMMRDAWLHRSPNAGWPEAAMAASLGIRLAGPRVYDGALTDDPWLNAIADRPVTAKDIEASVTILWKAWAMLLAVAAVLGGFWLLLGFLF
ncbi:MAG: adenosylcobinamide-phosphate synthase CbiB [Pseudomonadota bacterium]